ncbi:MAG: hypothetical protein ACKO8O_18380, partial [Betaproteobacteria bacterium]
MTRARALILLIGVLAAAGVGIGWWKAQRPQPIPPANKTTATPAARPLEFGPTEVIRLAPVALARAVPITGTVIAPTQTIVKSRVSGD